MTVTSHLKVDKAIRGSRIGSKPAKGTMEQFLKAPPKEAEAKAKQKAKK